MRRFAITLIGVFAVLAVGLICLMVVAIKSGGIRSEWSDIGSSNPVLVNTQNVSLDGIDDLILNYTWDDVVFLTSETEELTLKEYMNFSPGTDDLTQITTTGSRLKLERQRMNINNWFVGINRYSRVEIYLPSGYGGELAVSTSSGNIESDITFNIKNFKAASTSGDIRLNEINAETVSSSTSSGNITIDKAAGKRSFSSTSGDIQILDGAGDTSAASSSGNITLKNSSGSLKASASSGDIKIENSLGEKDIQTTSGQIIVNDSAGYTEASASSGDIRFTGFDGAGDFDTTSGSINIEYTQNASLLPDDLYMSASSGDLILELPSGFSFDFSAKTSSGDISTPFDDQLTYNKDGDYATGTIGANPSYGLELTTTSGTIRIRNR